MMKLSTLWKIDATVDAGGCTPTAEHILTHWSHEAGSLRFFRSSANFLYRFQQDGESFFLRFADNAERSRAMIEAEIALVNWLDGAGIDVATPIPSRNGHFVETIKTELGAFYAVVFAGLPGSQVEIDDLDRAGFDLWGASLGALHAALKQYPAASSTARPSWREQFEWAREQIAGDTPAIQNEWAQIIESLGTLPVNHESFGLIHFDFELDNLVWHEGRFGILDFDDCARTWYVADIAYALRDLFTQDPSLNSDSFRAFVQGYATHCPIDEESIEKIPLFLRMGNLLRYARISHSLDLAPDQEYPDWLHALAGKLQNYQEVYKNSLEAKAL